jgi:hypothetical protein
VPLQFLPLICVRWVCIITQYVAACVCHLFVFGVLVCWWSACKKTLCMFRTVSPSIIRSLRLCIEHHTIQVLWILASKQPRNLYDISDAVCTVLGSWWWTERPPETCSVLFQNKINLRYCASGWFYYRNLMFILVSSDGQTFYCVTNSVLRFEFSKFAKSQPTFVLNLAVSSVSFKLIFLESKY